MIYSSVLGSTSCAIGSHFPSLVNFLSYFIFSSKPFPLLSSFPSCALTINLTFFQSLWNEALTPSVLLVPFFVAYVLPNNTHPKLS